MTFIELFLIALGLSMDAAAVSLTNGVVCCPLSLDKKLAIPLCFGLFQGLMPLLGYLTGSLFAQWMDRYAGIICFLILGTIGGKMIYEGFLKQDTKPKSENLTYKVLLLQAIATSIDAFAVGVGFCAAKVLLLPAVSIIAVITGVCCMLALLLGRSFGCILGNKGEIFGGSILLLIGIKSLF